MTSAGGLDYVTEKAGITAQQETPLAARCPSGTSTAGGGAEATGPFGDEVLAGTEPLDFGDQNTKPDDGWHGLGDNLSASGPGKLKVYAICGAGQYDYSSSAVGASVPAHGSTGAGFNCGVGSLISGGVSVDSTGFGQVSLKNLFPSDAGYDPDADADDYFFAYSANSTNAAKLMRVHLVCATGQYQYVQRDVLVSNQAQSTVKAKCPAGTHVTGGGLNLNGNLGEMTLTGSRPYDGKDADRAPDDGWISRVDVTGLGGNRSGTAYATCKA